MPKVIATARVKVQSATGATVKECTWTCAGLEFPYNTSECARRAAADAAGCDPQELEYLDDGHCHPVQCARYIDRGLRTYTVTGL
jgi:hypothetical protein